MTIRILVGLYLLAALNMQGKDDKTSAGSAADV